MMDEVAFTRAGAGAWLICYDIRDPRRLVRVHRLMRNECTPLQYSVFLCEVTKRELRTLLERTRRIIDEEVDDVRAYRIEARAGIRTLGVDARSLHDGCYEVVG